MPVVQKQMIPKVDKINPLESPNKPIALKGLHFKRGSKSSELVPRERGLVSALVASITNKWQTHRGPLGIAFIV